MSLDLDRLEVVAKAAKEVSRIENVLVNADEALELVAEVRQSRVFLPAVKALADNTIQQLRVERDAAVAALDRVKALHRPQAQTYAHFDPKCSTCGTQWPCDTVAAIEGGDAS